MFNEVIKVVYVVNSGVNDIILSIAELLTLLNYYCPKCEVIYYTDLINQSLGWVDYNDENQYYLNLKAIDKRFKYFSKSMEINDSFIKTPDTSVAWLFNELDLGGSDLFEETNEFLKYNWAGVGATCRPLFLDKINKVLYLTTKHTFSGLGKFQIRYDSSEKVIPWKDKFNKDYSDNIKKILAVQVDSELQKFIDNENLKDCIGLHLRLDHENIIQRFSWLAHDDVYAVNIGSNFKYNGEKISQNLKYYNRNEFLNSHLRNIENFIIKNNNCRIFICSDCSVTVNYFAKKYDHVFQYREEDISESYSKYFINGDTSIPYLRKHDEIEFGINNLCGFLSDRVIKDYLSFLNCGYIFTTFSGIKRTLEFIDIEHKVLLIEHQVMENLGVIGV